MDKGAWQAVVLGVVKSLTLLSDEAQRKQVASGSAYMFPSSSLCLLLGAFNPFTFKVIIDMYDPITIFLIVLGLFSVAHFLLLYPA